MLICWRGAQVRQLARGLCPDLSNMIQSPGSTSGCCNTAPVLSASIIDAIPDEAILANERTGLPTFGPFVLNGEEVPAGFAARLSHKRVGNSGWKANIGNCPEFVRVAWANELGLGNTLLAQPASLSKPDYRPRRLDLTDEQCDQMTAFIAWLPRPQEVIPGSPSCPRAVAGEKHFKQIGDANCHTPDLAEAQVIYSDLLVHQMGRGLVAVDPPMEKSRRTRQRSRTPTVARRPQANGARRRCGVLQIPLPIFTTAEQRPWPRPSSCTPVRRRRLRIASRVSPTSSKKS